MICPNCQTENRESARFCDECGYELPSVEPLRHSTITLPEDPFDSLDLIVEDPVVTMPADSGFAPTGDLGPLESRTTIELDDDQQDADRISLPVITERDGVSSSAFTAPIAEPPSSVVASYAVGSALSDTARGYRANDPAQYADTPRPKKSKKKAFIIVGIAILIAAAIAGITAAVQLFSGSSVPNVIGMSQVDATYLVQEAGFRVQVEEVVSDEVEGIVLSTDPAAGIRMAEGSTVTLRISIARLIPDVVGMSLDAAQARMGEEGFTNLEIVRIKSNEPEDTVLSLSPEPLTRARADALIALEVAEPFRIPDVVNMSQQEAVSALEAEGYVVSIQRYNTEDAPEGTAIRTEPPAGSVLDSGSQVVLLVAHNRSVELVELTRKFFTDSPTITINGQLYEMSKLGDVTYAGGNSCSFSLTVRPIQTVTWFGTQTETRYGNYQTINGTITWTESNEIASIEPPIKQGG